MAEEWGIPMSTPPARCRWWPWAAAPVVAIDICRLPVKHLSGISGWVSRTGTAARWRASGSVREASSCETRQAMRRVSALSLVVAAAVAILRADEATPLIDAVKAGDVATVQRLAQSR